MYDNLTQALLLQERYDEAEESATVLIDVTEGLYGEVGPMAARSRGFLARALDGTGDAAGAEAILVRDYERLLADRGAESGVTRTAAGRLVRFYERAGRSEDAARFREAQARP